jgi:adenosylcobinamide kinase/adenosylcobinamide-phosphate guanylyltransferase
MRELILGGQRSGKSARAEALVAQWLGQSGGHRAVFIATARPWDDEMRERIERHRRDRAQRLPGLRTVEEPLQLAQAIAAHSQSDTVVVVDCLTLWLTNWLMPAGGADSPHVPALAGGELAAQTSLLWTVVGRAVGPVVLVSNEIGLGVIPLGRDVRAFVDALGRLNQQAGAACEQVTLMAAGLPLVLKGAP